MQHPRKETGDIINPLKHNLVQEHAVFSMGKVSLGILHVDTTRTTAYKSAGMALFDLFVAKAMYRAAYARYGAGRYKEALVLFKLFAMFDNDGFAEGKAMLIDVEQIRLDPGAVKGPWVLEKVLDRRVPGIELGHRALCVDGTWTRGLVRLGWD